MKSQTCSLLTSGSKDGRESGGRERGLGRAPWHVLVSSPGLSVRKKLESRVRQYWMGLNSGSATSQLCDPEHIL